MIRNWGGATNGGGVRGGVAFFFQVGLSFPSSLGFAGRLVGDHLAQDLASGGHKRLLGDHLARDPAGGGVGRLVGDHLAQDLAGGGLWRLLRDDLARDLAGGGLGWQARYIVTCQVA